MKFRALSAALAAATVLAMPTPGFAVEPELDIPSFSHLRRIATDSVDVTLDGFLMRIARKFAASQAADSNDPNDEAISLLKDIKSVRVRNFTFDSDNAYSKADIDSVRKQLQAPGWSSLVQVHRREGNEDVDVYVCLENDKVKGLAVIASEPREFTIVNIVGSIDLDKVSMLGGEFGIPKMTEHDE